MFKRILVPLDGSFRAEQAVPMAARIARGTGGSIHLVRVVNPPLHYYSVGWAPGAILTEQVINADMNEAKEYVKKMAASPLLRGIKTSSEVAFALGSTDRHIIEAAKAYKADLIVLCSHERTGLTRWALGSVAHGLVHHSTFPLLVLRQNKAAPSHVRVAMIRPLNALVPLAERAFRSVANIEDPAMRIH